MDELKLSKTLRHHTDAVSATALLHGLPVSAGKDGCVCVWDAAAPNSPLVVLEAGGPVHALQLQEEKGKGWLLRCHVLNNQKERGHTMCSSGYAAADTS
jgi:WD40 repeat protein